MCFSLVAVSLCGAQGAQRYKAAENSALGVGQVVVLAAAYGNGDAERIIGRLIHTGTIASYDMSAPRVTITEATDFGAMEQRNIYARAKAEGERRLLALQAQGLRLVIARPGIVLGDNILANKENNFIASVYFGRQTTGVAFLDISTGEFYVAEGADSYVDKLISNLQPKEVVYQRGYEDRFSGSFGSKLYTYRLDEWVFSEDVNREKLCKQFGTKSLKGFGVDHFTSGISAAGACWVAQEIAKRERNATIVFIVCDRGDRYLSTGVFPA